MKKAILILLSIAIWLPSWSQSEKELQEKIAADESAKMLKSAPGDEGLSVERGTGVNAEGFALFGNPNGGHIAIDTDDIQRKTGTGASYGTLFHNYYGGSVNIANGQDGGNYDTTLGGSTTNEGALRAYGALYAGGANDRVGIGTTVPNAKLQINVTDFTTENALVANGFSLLELIRVNGNADGSAWKLGVQGDQIIRDGKLRVIHATDDDQTRFVGNSDCKIQLERTGSDWVVGSEGSGDFVLMKNVTSTDFSDVKNEYEFWTSYFRPSDDNQIALGLSSNRWTTVYAANGTINTSDRREKKNIAPITYGLNEIMALQPVSYDWINDSNKKKKLGLIAQDLKEVIDEVVEDGHEGYTREDGSVEGASDRLGVYYSDLIPVLIKGMQEQQAQIEDLKGEIASLKAQIEE